MQERVLKQLAVTIVNPTSLPKLEGSLHTPPAPMNSSASSR
jgi:hypothetical protein